MASPSPFVPIRVSPDCNGCNPDAGLDPPHLGWYVPKIASARWRLRPDGIDGKRKPFPHIFPGGTQQLPGLTRSQDRQAIVGNHFEKECAARNK